MTARKDDSTTNSLMTFSVLRIQRNNRSSTSSLTQFKEAQRLFHQTCSNIPQDLINAVTRRRNRFKK